MSAHCQAAHQQRQRTVDLAAFGFQRHYLAEKGHKLLGGMAGGGLTQDFAAFGVQRSVERERTMPKVLEAVALGSPGRSGSTGSRRSRA